MSSNIVLNVDVREGTGKGAARAARREDLVPGVLYGGDQDPVSINLRGNEIRKALLTGQFISHMMELEHEASARRSSPATSSSTRCPTPPRCISTCSA